MKTWILISLFLVSAGACKKTQHQKTEQLQFLISDSCAQNPVNFLEEEQGSGQKLYVFGPQDQEFRLRWTNLQNSFRASGRDLNGAEKLAFVSRYVPGFIKACNHFFSAAAQRCGGYSPGSSEMQKCLGPYNNDFRQYLNQKLSANDSGLVDLESLPDPQ